MFRFGGGVVCGPGWIVDLFACAVEVGAATESLVVLRCSAFGAGSFVDRGQIDAFASLLVGTATDVGVFIVCKGGGLRSTRTAAGMYRFAVLPLASLCRCLRASSDNVVIAVDPNLRGPAGGCACFGPTGSVADSSHPRVLSASVRGGWQMCTLVWGGWRVAFLFRDGSGGAFAAWDLHSERQWFAWGIKWFKGKR